MSINPTARDIRKEENRERISQAAMKLYSKYSFEEVSVADICHACGLSTGSFYHLFGSKDNTSFLALAASRDRYIAKNFTLDDTQDFFTQFYDFIMVNIEHNVSVNKSLLGATYASLVTQKCAQNLLPGRPYCDGLAAVVRRGLALDAFRVRMNEAQTYRFLNMLIIGIAEDWCAHNGPDEDDLCRLFARQLIGAAIKESFIPPDMRGTLFHNPTDLVEPS